MTHPEPIPLKRTGEIFLAEGLISPEDVEQVMAVQGREQDLVAKDRRKLFGAVLCDLNLVSPQDSYCALDRHGKLLSLPRYLAKTGMVPKERLDQLEAEAARAQVPFISFLLDHRVIPKEVLQQVLFDLFHLPFRSVSDIVFEENLRDALASVIGKKDAAKHGCIPLKFTGNILLIGMTDPSGLTFLKHLDQTFPQYRLTPVFIPFSGFTWFFQMLYQETWADQNAGARPVDLSLLMKFSILVADPESDREAINDLFDRYERVASQGSGTRDPQRKGLFFEFIRLHHARISSRRGHPEVRFFLKRDQGRLKVMALAQQEGLVPWQK